MWSKLARTIWALPWVFWLIALPGFVLPWVTGAGVKVYLDAQGSPTIPWEYFVNPGAMFVVIPVTIFWAGPHIVLGLKVTAILEGRSGSLHWATRPQQLFVLGVAFVCGTVALVAAFINVFRNFDPIALLLPIPVFYGLIMILGALLGCVVVRVSSGIKRQINKWLAQHRASQ